MKIGILTGGGDCPGLNAVIRAIVRKGIFHYQDEFVGYLEGWRGVMENMTRTLDLEAVKGILPQGGTILRTSRTNPSKREGGLDTCLKNLKQNGVEALIALGGDDTQSVSKALFDRGFKLVAVRTALQNVRIFSALFLPGWISTPEAISTPQGWNCSTTLPTFSGCNFPATK